MSKPSRRPSRQKTRHAHPQNLTDYHHRQPAGMLLAIISFPFAVCAVAAWTHPEHRTSLVTGCILLALLAAQFSSLNISVTEKLLSWRFGAGLIRKQVAVSEIASAEIVRSTLLDGWGIHYTRRGWLYNVSGRDAVLITRKDGKSFLLGSDDVIGLWEAIQNRIAS